MARVQELKERLEAAKKAKNDLIASSSFDATNYELNLFTSQFSLMTDLITRLEKELKQAEEFEDTLNAKIKDMVVIDAELESKRSTGCSFCMDENCRIKLDFAEFSIIRLTPNSKPSLYTHFMSKEGLQMGARITIEYCPFCGRNL